MSDAGLWVIASALFSLSSEFCNAYHVGGTPAVACVFAWLCVGVGLGKLVARR